MERKLSLILNIWRKGGRKAALLYLTTSDKKFGNQVKVVRVVRGY